MLMEGDLLEVMLDEVQQLWQLLQSDTEFLAAFEGVTRGGKGGGEVEEEKEADGEKVCVCSALSIVDMARLTCTQYCFVLPVLAIAL